MSREASGDAEHANRRLGELAAENRRLRSEFGDGTRSAYRRSGAGLIGVGVLAIIGGAAFSGVREILFVLGAIGVFTGILTYYLTPETFVTADVGERVYSALAGNHAALADALELREEEIYVPGEHRVSLFVPDGDSEELPDLTAGPLITDPETRGIVLEATGSVLLETIGRDNSWDASSLQTRAETLGDILVEQFELVDAVECEIDPNGGRASFGIVGSAFGDLDRFDHPVPSFLAAGLANYLEEPLTVDVIEGDDRRDWLITCTW